MISREDGNRKLFEAQEPFDEDEFGYFIEISKARKVLNSVYDSIGSCGECKYLDDTKKRVGQGKCIKLGFYTTLDFFCADFERKEDE